LNSRLQVNRQERERKGKFQEEGARDLFQGKNPARKLQGSLFVVGAPLNKDGHYLGRFAWRGGNSLFMKVSMGEMEGVCDRSTRVYLKEGRGGRSPPCSIIISTRRRPGVTGPEGGWVERGKDSAEPL